MFLSQFDPVQGWINTSFLNSSGRTEHDQSAENILEAESRCLRNMYLNMSDSEMQSELGCDGIWDNVFCWPPTPAGTLAIKHCSEVFPTVHSEYGLQYEGNVTLECLKNGTWADTNEFAYDNCLMLYASFLSEMEKEKMLTSILRQMIVAGSTISMIMLTIVLLIFRCYRSLHSKRVSIQTHLMISIMCRTISMLLVADPLKTEGISYQDMDNLCKSILVLFLYFTSASATWMFIQGLFITIDLLCINFKQNLKIYYLLGWVLPAGLAGLYVIAMVNATEEKCWRGYPTMTEKWILQGPTVFELVMNGLFFINIVRVIYKKARNSNSVDDFHQIKATAKGIAILIPILGRNNLLLVLNPGSEYDTYLLIFNLLFGSIQGAFVAAVFCFINKEKILSNIRRTIQLANTRRRIGLQNFRRTSVQAGIPMVQLSRHTHPVQINVEVIMAETSV